MDLCSIPAFIIMVCLLGAAPPVRSEADCKCPCSKPPLPKPLTKPPQAENCCHNRSTFRYQCIDGYVRKAGTSNLVRCTETAGIQQWTDTKLPLICIPDPNSQSTEQLTSTEHTTTAPTSLQTTQNPNISASVAAEKDSAPPTPRVNETGETDRTTSSSSSSSSSSPPSSSSLASTEPSDSSYSGGRRGAGAVVSGLSAVGALIIACALMGIGFLWWKRSRNADPQPREEHIPMNPAENDPSGARC